jgi:glycosyltransferase involved in cell wall biosynthesis
MSADLSLAMMARNAESTILRTLRNVEPYVSEFVLTDNMSDDNTVAIARAWAEEIQKKRPFRFEVFSFTPDTNPECFVLDTRETFAEAPFASLVEYSGLPLLTDWALMRNQAVSRATLPYVLMVDADDLFVSPELIPSMVQRMLVHKRDVLNCTYQIMSPRLSYPGCELICWRIFERAALGPEGVRWIGSTHEHVVGDKRSCFAPDLIVRDMRDNAGSGARVSSRALKILWLEARTKGMENVSPRVLYYLGTEALRLNAEMARPYLELCTSKSTDKNELTSSHLMLAEIDENAGDYESSLENVKKASKDRTPDVCFTEGRIMYKMANLVQGGDPLLLPKVVEVLGEGLLMLSKAKRRLVTRNPTLERGSYILLTETCLSLGMVKEGREWACKGLEAFPGVEYLASVAQKSWSL